MMICSRIMKAGVDKLHGRITRLATGNGRQFVEFRLTPQWRKAANGHGRFWWICGCTRVEARWNAAARPRVHGFKASTPARARNNTRYYGKSCFAWLWLGPSRRRRPRRRDLVPGEAEPRFTDRVSKDMPAFFPLVAGATVRLNTASATRLQPLVAPAVSPAM